MNGNHGNDRVKAERGAGTVAARRRDTALALCCLLLGGAPYLLFRPTSLLMFHWFDALGLADAIAALRAWLHGADALLPAWSVFSLPSALWLLSYLLLLKAIWGDSLALVRSPWFWCLPLGAILAELAQSVNAVPGHFDPADLVALALAVILGTLLTARSQMHEETAAP